VKVAGRLTERDRWLCEMLFQHKVLTTNNVCDLAFDNLTTTRHRLTELHALRLVDRFRPWRVAGSAALHYVLDEMGAEVVAATRGVERDQLGWRRERSLAIATSQRLDHLVGVNSFFTALVRSTRQHTGASLLEWWSEQRCAAEWGDIVRPDGFGVWAEDDAEVAFFLEFDCGTERLHRLATKVARYAELAKVVTFPALVLFALPSPGRENEARRVLAKSDVAVATAVLAPGESPDGPVWQIPGRGAARHRLGRVLEARAGLSGHRRHHPRYDSGDRPQKRDGSVLKSGFRHADNPQGRRLVSGPPRAGGR
jgi:hypothetical protein